MEKIIKITRGLDKALSVLRIVWITVSAIVVIASLIAFIVVEHVVKILNQSSMEMSFTSGALKMWLHKPVLTADDLRAFLLMVIVVGAVELAATLYAIHLFKRILSEMKKGHPFSQNIPAHIRHIAYMIFAYTALFPIIEFVLSYFTTKLIGVHQILTALPLVERMELRFNYSISIFAVFIGFTVILLSLVFEYGMQLQQEADETL